MRRLLLLFLFLLSSSAFAERIPATMVWKASNNWAVDYSDPNAACASNRPAPYSLTRISQQSETIYYCHWIYNNSGSEMQMDYAQRVAISCPSGATPPWSLSGAECVRACPDGQTEAPDGQCSDKCRAVAGQTTTSWMAAAVGSPSLEGQQYCDNGCSAGVNASPTGTAYVNGKMRLQRYEIVQLGFTCSSGPSLPGSVTPDKTPPEPPKKPPCAATEGVLTSSTGTVACVPPGTPSSDLPAVTKTKNTEAFPDGSTKTTETTTTRDKQTGAEDKSTSTTSTPNSSGGQGQAGPVGTSTTQGSSSSTTGGDPTKPGDSDFCAKNPNLQICKGGMSEEATQKKVQEAAEKIRDSLDAKDFDAATHFKPIALSEEGQAKIDEAIGKMNADIAKFGTSADPSSGFYDNFKNQMTDWIGPISNSGCQPFSGRIGPYTWNLDHCPTAAKISAIGAYCMWVMLAFGVFALTTRNRS